MTILDDISEKMDSFSNKQKDIAKYLMKNSRKVGFMSLKELSEEIGVSEVTVLNFCKIIGVNSFVDLKKLFQDLVKRELNIPKEIKNSLLELESVEDAYNNTIQIQRLNYDKIIRENSLDEFKEISKTIMSANKIYICGMGMSKVMAEYLSSRLALIDIESDLVDVGDLLTTSMDLKKITRKDIFIIISFPEYSPNAIGLSKYLLKEDIPYISITDNNSAPIAKGAKNTLVCPNNSLVFHNFISSTISLVELLLVILSFMMKDSLVEHFSKLDDVQNDLVECILK